MNKQVKLVSNILLLLLIMASCTVVSMLFRYIGAFESSIGMIYVLGIILFAYLAVGYLYSLVASITSVLVYNFFFTEPYFTFHVYSPRDTITFLVMFLVGLITSMLTLKIKGGTALAEDRAAKIKALYLISRRLLGVKSDAALATVLSEEIARELKCHVSVLFFDATGAQRYRHVEGNNVFSTEREAAAEREAYQSGIPCGCGTPLFSDCSAYYLPVVGQSGVSGVIGIALPDRGPLQKDQQEFVETLVAQAAVVLERERLYEKQQEIQSQVQRERLRADILRSISHDLRTPLTGIMGLASTALAHYDEVSDQVKLDFLKNIYLDADWLHELVENILSSSRFEEGHVKLNREEEAAEEIVAEAIGHVKKRAPHHKIQVDMPEAVILFQVDGVLIRQVLVNLLNNAINQTTEENRIRVTLWQQDAQVFFRIADNGPGITPEDLPHIFDRFYTGKGQNKKNKGSRGGMGLGLSLCKAIIEAHGGGIKAENLEPQGTAITFSIPTSKE